jgi:glycosyltransferase involved in cell wall biosynthesis
MWYEIINISGVVVTGVSTVASWKMWRTLREFHGRTRYSSASLIEKLPSVSVCIPARNERHMMTRCLEQVLASRYPKLEVIVFDDCSTDDTSALIRAFAHDGVRFIEGSPPGPEWLGKNHALQRLLDEASGRYVVFMDVDTEVSPDTIGQLVAHMDAHDLTMLSALPQRHYEGLIRTIISPLRYFWSLLLHSRRRPACASNLWMVRRTTCIADGGFHPLAADIQPEVTLAARYIDHYHFLLSHRLLRLRYYKTMRSQFETAVRLRYPLLGRSLLRSVLCVMAEVLLVAIWIVMIYTSPVIGILLILLSCLPYALYCQYAARGGIVLLMPVVFPFLIVLDAVITIVSAAKYLSGTVTWKGRPIQPS